MSEMIKTGATSGHVPQWSEGDRLRKALEHASPAVTSIYVDTLAEASRAAVDAAASWRTS